MDDYELAKSILDRHSFTRKRTIECVVKWGGLPASFNPYTKSKLLIAPTLTTSCDSTCATGTVLIKESKNMSEYAIRKLTPTECYILMGMTKEDADKAYAVGMSDSALYKSAGNGIVTNCPQLIFEHLYKAIYEPDFKCTDESETMFTEQQAKKQPLTANILFSGVGMQDRGIVNSECWDLNVLTTSDIDKNAVVTYAAIHCGLTEEMVENYSDYPSREEMVSDLEKANLGYDPIKDKRYDWAKLAKKKSKELEKFWLANKLSKNVGDISKLEKLPVADLWTYSFPCTDISVAGKMKGMVEGGTRSGLLYEVTRLLEQTPDEEKPKFLLMENVKNLVGKQFKPQFDELCEFLERLGYNNYWEVMNAKNTGIPQNRERVFMLSIRKDIDSEQFTFPKPFDNGVRLKDVLFDKVDTKYYITCDRAKVLIEKLVESDRINMGGV